MAILKESCNFVSQVIVMVNKNASMLTDAGFDPSTRSADLKTKRHTADDTEGEQQKAQAIALDATKHANATLKMAYDYA